MNNWIDIKGASGTLYRYTLAENARPKTAVSGTFVYMRHDRKGDTLIYAGQTLNLSEGATELWQRAVSEHGATHMFTRLNVAGAARDAELSDLFAVEAPPMNDAPVVRQEGSGVVL